MTDERSRVCVRGGSLVRLMETRVIHAHWLVPVAMDDDWKRDRFRLRLAQAVVDLAGSLDRQGRAGRFTWDIIGRFHSGSDMGGEASYSYREAWARLVTTDYEHAIKLPPTVETEGIVAAYDEALADAYDDVRKAAGLGWTTPAYWWKTGEESPLCRAAEAENQLGLVDLASLSAVRSWLASHAFESPDWLSEYFED